MLSLPVILLFLFVGVSRLPLGAWERIRHFIVALSGPSIYLDGVYEYMRLNLDDNNTLMQSINLFYRHVFGGTVFFVFQVFLHGKV